MKEECLFCKIINREITSYKIYEDEQLLVFLDLNQEYPGHSLIVTKKHYVTILEIPNDLLIHIFDVVKKLEKKYKEILKIDGLTLLQNNGIAQDIKHFHLHLIPKYKNKKSISIEEVYEKLK